MKNYIKPSIDVLKIAPEVTIAAGLEDWMMGNELSADSNITTFEYISE